jgi:uncharacterized surface protein with fasciclin (FAS1) repeats
MNILKNIYKLAAMALIATPLAVASCSDEPAEENYYTFTGEMMSDFLNNNEEYSMFRQVVERADMMSLLSTYGHYTCFAPNNTAMQAYLSKKGKGSLDELTQADCDTLARTLLRPSELPVGSITSIIGTPLFIYLLYKNKRGY